MQVKTFGKRTTSGGTAPSGTTPPSTLRKDLPQRPAQDNVARLIPKEIWDGPHGAMLRKLRFEPDDPRNLVLTPQRARAMEEDATSQMNALVAKVNAHSPGVAVLPWAMIPWTTWQGLNAEFLIKADFLASSPWNNMLLAADEESSVILGLPVHPRAAMPDIDSNVKRLIDELRAERGDELNKTFAALSRGDMTALERYEATKNDRFQKLFALARHVANLVFGDAVCERHDELFGVGLTKVTG